MTPNNSKIPAPISPFCEQHEFHFEEFIRPFLEDFAEDISKSIRAEDSPIDYVPAQILTEFIRVNTFGDGKPIDGILYKSSIREDGICAVLFKGPDISCEAGNPTEEAWLNYIGYELHRVTRIHFEHSVSES